MSLSRIGPLEHQDVSSTPAHCRIQCVQSIGAHQHDGGESAIRESIDATNEGVDACPILMVHLIGFARLGQCVGLVN